ncbi:serpin family protein [Aliifodinibius salicampi]|uniref:Serpin family protein n=1 Tax=Fodinibius salicampi TaxID=1920655 RepID=A0ABT3Q178_9BACT|nr:serpin family protein [Fodinibius salicampi]MCW9713879.1 serpin family protein [Fodinibius salicampi]
MKNTKPNYLLLASLVISILFIGCSSLSTGQDGPEEFERRELPRQLSEQEAELVDGSGHFGFALMHQLVDDAPDQNHFVSPLSILMAYGMTMNGAEGETYTQMQETFGMEGMSREEINESARELLELLSQFDDNVQFNIANSIWYRDSFSIEEDFLVTNQDYYDAVIEAADFDDPATVDRINSWVDDKTEGLIDEILQGPIDPLTVMYLINAIYFDGDWTVPFDPENTQTKPFHLADGSTIETDMMHQEEQEDMHYRKGEDYEAVNLYYGDAGFSMTLVLPDKDVGLENWVNDLNWNKWQELTEGFNNVTLTLDMPKFETEYEIENFKKVLQEMGIVDAFNPAKSDFSRINPAHNDLHISDTRHKTFVRVNEEGTEAAAATSVGMNLTSVGPQSVQINFDRPFFYVIREVESETILFMGTMNDPSSS